MPRFIRKVIRISAYDSPNIQLALAQKARGQQPTGEIVVPGVLPYDELLKRLATWDDVKIEVGIHGRFYKGADVLLYPPQWLDRAAQLDLYQRCQSHPAEAIGVDPAEGGDETAIAIVNRYGLKDLISKKTPDTSVTTADVLAQMKRYGVPSEKVLFDRGGGGKEHADRLRSMGYPVNSVGFGEGIVMDPKRGLTRIEDRILQREERYAYKNRRAQMYGELRELLDPARAQTNPSGEGGESRGGRDSRLSGFSIPTRYTELRRQLAPLPLLFGKEGQLFLPPKHARDGEGINSFESNGKRMSSIVELLGGTSPDQADALVLAIHAMLHTKRRVVAGAI